MRVLFVGEGTHDIGPPVFNPQPRTATGTVATLARRVCPVVSKDSVALQWREIPVWDRKKRTRGFAAKVASAIAVSESKFGLDGTVCVSDRDRDEQRLPAMEEGQMRGLAAVSGTHQVVCGVAVESIEAWTLGSPDAIANVLGVKVETIHAEYRLRDVESFSQRSDKPENRPKDILSRVADLAHRKDDVDFRVSVAENTDVELLGINCPIGFKPFADKLTAAFGPR